ncbi:MAG: hypothetical protein ACOYK7_06820 [Pirellulales bacterium]|jgi:hypothetical protein
MDVLHRMSIPAAVSRARVGDGPPAFAWRHLLVVGTLAFLAASAVLFLLA